MKGYFEATGKRVFKQMFKFVLGEKVYTCDYYNERFPFLLDVHLQGHGLAYQLRRSDCNRYVVAKQPDGKIIFSMRYPGSRRKPGKELYWEGGSYYNLNIYGKLQIFKCKNYIPRLKLRSYVPQLRLICKTPPMSFKSTSIEYNLQFSSAMARQYPTYCDVLVFILMCRYHGNHLS